MADAALMRLEAKRAKGPAGLLVPEDAPAPPAGLAPKAPEEAVVPAAGLRAEIPHPEKPNEVAARLEAALRGHLESVASALASTRAEEAVPKPPALNGRSIYAPDRSALKTGHDLRLPAVTLLDLDALPLPPVAESDGVHAGEADRDEDEFGRAPLAWLAGEDEHEDGEHKEDRRRGPDDLDTLYDDDDEPLPAALRRAWREPEPVAHLPPIVEPSGIGAKTLAVAALFGLAAGIGGIAAYQLTVAPAATPVVAVAPTMAPADSAKLAKLDADRVPQADDAPGIEVAAAAGRPARAASPAATPEPAIAAAAVPEPAPLASAEPAAVTADAAPVAAIPPTLRKTGDPGDVPASGDLAAADQPSDVEPFAATVSVRPAPRKAPAVDPQVLAYAPTPKPNDPVARSFFGNVDDGDAADGPAKKSAAKAAPTPSPGKAKVLMAVNMRAKPDNDAPSIKILGAGARVQVVQCDMWCTVIADGKRGYIFKKFLDN